MNEYRCTRPDCYPATSAGATDSLARQGYYLSAADDQHAREQMREAFPQDTRFDVQVWSASGRPT